MKLLAGALLLIVGSAPACGRFADAPDGIDETRLPADVRADYDLFAQRCSKCHSLARPLLSGITDDGFWMTYVERMRRQPGSGISPRDEEPILRFLHYYSIEEKRRHGGGAVTLPARSAVGAKPCAL